MATALAWTSVSAQFTLTGNVLQAATREPLVGATVQIQNSNQATVTDALGGFSLTNISNVRVTIVVRFVGFEEFTQEVDLQKSQAMEVLMMEAQTVAEDVIVTATRVNEKSPFTFTQVDAPIIQKQNFGQDMPFLLNWTPSLVTTSDAGAGIGYTGLRIRGSDATRINVTINGIPYNDSESQGTFWVDIPDVASSTKSIQIQRGVGTSTNGGSAFGASVNLQTNSLNAEPYADVITAAGSFNSQRYTARAGTGLIDKHWSFDAKVSKILSDGYVDRASSDLSSYYISGGYYGKKTVLKAITFGGHEITYQSWWGVDDYTMKNIRRTFNYAGAIYDADFNVLGFYKNQVDDYRQDHYQLHLSQQVNEHWNANVSMHYTYGRGFYEEYHQDDSLKYLGLDDLIIRDTTIEAMDVAVRKWLDNKFYGATFSFNYEKGKSALTLGGALNRYGHAKHFGEIVWSEFALNLSPEHQYYAGRSQKDDFNIYAKWTYQLSSRLSAFADLQFRRVHYKTAGIRDDQSPYSFNESFNFFNPKAGLTYTLNDKSLLYASYALANREPNRSDYLDGSVKPKPEQLGNLETGWRKKIGKTSLDVNYYLMHYTNQLVLTGALDNVGYPIRANVGKSFRTGVEASAMITFSDKWNWNLNATLAQNKNKNFVLLDENNVATSKNTTITLSPSLIAGSQLTWMAFRNFTISWMAKYVSKQYLDNAQNKNLTLNEYFVNDCRLTYQVFPKGMKEIGFSLLINNILNAQYASNGYVYDATPYYFPQAGRNFMAMVTLRF